MFRRSFTFTTGFGFACLIALTLSSVARAQSGMEVLKSDVGTWNCEVRMFEPGSEEPQISKGTETCHMLGDMWLVSSFKGEMMGMEFQGASFTGYDAESDKYKGQWIDSMSPFPMTMEGTWDEASKTMTSTGTGKDPTGNEMKFKITTVYKDDSRLFTMYMLADGQEEMKMMEIAYTRAPGGGAEGKTSGGAERKK